MIVTSKIAVDLTRLNIGAKVDAVQGDGNTRSVEITLLSGGAPWMPPEGVDVAIAYYQPDGHKGMYNKLADGSAAIAVSGNKRWIVAGGERGLSVWKSWRGKWLRHRYPIGHIRTLAFHPDDRILAIGDARGRIWL